MRRAAFGLYLFFMASWFLHLPARIPAFGQLRIDFVLVIAIAVLIFASSEDVPQRADRTIRGLIVLLVVYAVVSLPFVEWPGSVIKTGLPNFTKAAVFYFFTTALVTSERRLRWMLLVFVAAQTFRVLEPLYLHMTVGYWGSAASMANWERMNRLAGAPSDVVNGNGLAFVILTALPFWHFLAPLSPVGALAYAAVLPAFLYALVLTGSRSGIVGLGVVFVGVWMRSGRKVLLAALLVTGTLLVLPSLSADTLDRYASIVSSNTRNAATAHSRWMGLQADFAVALRRPVFGHGLGTSREANANFRATALPSHNLYTEIAQELGFVGLALFLALMVAVSRRLSAATRRLTTEATRSFACRTSYAVRVWLLMNIAFSIASYGLSSYEWYLLAGLGDVLARLAHSAVPDTAATSALPGLVPNQGAVTVHV